MSEDFIGYRRRIAIIPRAGRITVDLEDDAHRFGVTMSHDLSTITAMETRSVRYPWTSCGAAGAFLAQRFVGLALADAATAADQRSHCTHLYDLVILAVAHAGERNAIIYDMRVSDRQRDTRLADICQNGEYLLSWKFAVPEEDGQIPEYQRQEFDQWTRGLPPEKLEAGRMLRRAVMVSGVRTYKPRLAITAAELPNMIGLCFTFDAVRSGSAARMPANRKDFSQNSGDLLADIRHD